MTCVQTAFRLQFDAKNRPQIITYGLFIYKFKNQYIKIYIKHEIMYSSGLINMMLPVGSQVELATSETGSPASCFVQ